jgi:hypothetical protein
MADCIVGCAEDIPVRYDNAGCAPVIRAFGYNRFVLFKCGVSFTDILDTDEWADKITSGDVIVSPSFGTFTPGTPNVSTIPGGCGETYPEYMETPWNFSTPSTDAGYDDEDWWFAVSEGYNGYTMGYINCDGRLFLNDTVAAAWRAWTTGALAATDPGFKISLTQLPIFGVGPNGVGKAGIWTVAGNFIHTKNIRSIEIPGLVAVLTAEVAP